MPDTIVDTNVFIDLSQESEEWFVWSSRSIANAADTGRLIVNQVIYSELAGAYASREDLETVLTRGGIRKENIPWDASFMAGLMLKDYRRRGGKGGVPLPDFFIGAHAAVRGYRLLTRDRGFFRSCFATLQVITPETHP